MVQRTRVEVHAEVERLLDVLRASLDDIASEMVANITAEIPAYGRTADTLAGDVHAHCREHAGLLVETVREEREPRRDELDFARRAAARRVRQGIPLQALLQAFRLGHRTLWDAIVQAAPETVAGREAALALARPAMQYIDMVSTHVAESYLKEEQRQLATADRERRDLLENLLTGRLPRADDIPAAAAGIDRHDELLVAVGRVSSADVPDPNDVHTAADVIAAQCAGPGAEPLVVVRHSEIVAVIPAEADGDAVARIRAAQDVLAERRAILTRVGVSARFAGLTGVAQAYVEARQALLRSGEAPSLVALEELSTIDYLVAAADRTAWHVARRTSDALDRADPREERALADTVMAYVDCDLDVRKASRTLGVHPNTVRYRLRRVAAATGRDPARFHDLVELATVIRMARARSHPHGDG